jgi:hypothetical protein
LNARTAAILGGALAAYAALTIGYATATPIWQNPDEPAHFNYVAHVARTGGLPELVPGDWDSALLERLKNGRLEPGDAVEAIRYESWQPPLFYLAAAPVFLLAGNQDPSAVVLQLRLLNALVGALTLGVAFLVARELLPAPLAPAVPLAMVGVPMFTSVSASISADPLANVLSASLVLVLVRRIQQPCSVDDPRWPVRTAVLLGLGVLTKLAVGIFVPLALAVILGRSARRVRDGVLLVATTGLVALPWLIHQVTTYGWLDPLAMSRHAAVVLEQPRFTGLSVDYLIRFATISFHSIWAQFGWMGIVAPDRLYWTWGVLSLAALVGLAIDRRRLERPAWRFVLATLGMAVLAYIAYNLAFEQFQGRYLFTALVPIALLLVAGWAALLPNRVQAWGVLLVGSGLVVLNAVALTRVLVTGFAPVG